MEINLFIEIINNYTSKFFVDFTLKEVFRTYENINDFIHSLYDEWMLDCENKKYFDFYKRQLKSLDNIKLQEQYKDIKKLDKFLN